MNVGKGRILWAALLAAAILQGESALAGEQKGQQQDRLARMQENLQLSDEQVAEIRRIRENGGSREEFFAVLTEEQHEKLRANRAERKGRKGGERSRQGQSESQQ